MMVFFGGNIWGNKTVHQKKQNGVNMVKASQALHCTRSNELGPWGPFPWMADVGSRVETFNPGPEHHHPHSHPAASGLPAEEDRNQPQQTQQTQQTQKAKVAKECLRGPLLASGAEVV